jgi:hypothetical protein
MPVRMRDTSPPARASGGAARRRSDSGGRGSDDPYLVLPAEQAPPEGIQASEHAWALVTLRGEPVAFISPAVVARLDPDAPVGTLLDALTLAYAAEFANQPTSFFRYNLDGEVRGVVVVLEQAFADYSRGRVPVTDFYAAQCERGQILPIGEICDDSCRCPRRAET